MWKSRSFVVFAALCTATAIADDKQPVSVGPKPGLAVPLLLQPQSQEQPRWEEYCKLDFDKDGVDDAVLEVQRGRGSLSTYYGVHRLRTLNGFKLLMKGAPLAPGTNLTLRHVFERVDETALFSLAVSLRVKLRPEEAAVGPWWGKGRTALGVARIVGDDVQFGYVLLSVSDQGTITVDGVRLESVRPTRLEVPK